MSKESLSYSVLFGRQIVNTFYPTPEAWAQHASAYSRGLATYLTLDEMDVLRPHTSSGKYLQDRYRQYPDAFIPSEPLISSIVYAGKETVEELHEYTYDQIQQLDSAFPSIDDEPDTTLSLSEAVTNALGMVERHMAHDPKARRTGEKSIAHIYRGLLDMITFINTVNKTRKKTIAGMQNPMAFFTRRTATGALLTYALHDFCEDQFSDQDAPDEHAGVVEFSPEGQLAITRGTRKKGDTKLEHIDEQMTIATDYIITGKIKRSVDSLNVQNATGEPLVEVGKNALRERSIDTRDQADQRIIDIFGVLSKIFDRNDNLRTYPFVYDKQTGHYTVVPVEKIQEKCIEVITHFQPMQQIVYAVFAGPQNPMILDMLRLIQKFQPDFIPQKQYDVLHSLLYHEILKFFPTRVASQTLMGCTHDEIYKKPLYSPGLPVVL